MPMNAADIESAILAALPGAVVELRDLAGDDDHWAATVTAPQFAGLEHLHHDVTAADEFALHVKLGNRRPVGESLDALPDFHILQHIDGFIRHAAVVEDRDRLAGKAALRKQRRALHEQYDVIGGDEIGKAGIDVGHFGWRP